MTTRGDDDETTIIPPVPATPPAGVARPDQRVFQKESWSYGGGTARPYADGSQGQPPARIPQHARQDGSGDGWLGALLVIAVVAAAAFGVFAFFDAYFDKRIAEQRRVVVNYQMDWTLARTGDENVRQVCIELENPHSRGGVYDDFLISINRNFPEAPIADRDQVAAYLHAVCTNPTWEARRAP